MAGLKSMKITASERSKSSEVAEKYEPPAYPYGLQLSLDQDILEKLGVDKLPKVGTTLLLIAKVDVSSVSEHENAGDKKARRSLALQITDACLEANTADGKKAAAALYEGGK